ncbi:MAG: GTP-binding protein [Myxococcales bacterium]|nr:GTP-binding protein [Myxococcota bacterium]MDW8282475.1 GTP-binding protein [Myxococcales bacterium]
MDASYAAAPLALVTGFLGSGKTTLINRMLRCNSGLRLGVLVNEFGQIGIDGTLLRPGDVLELSDGCICCASGRELWEAARDLVDRARADHLLVETSGIAEPAALHEQYRELPTALRARLDLRGTLCVVDVIGVAAAAERRVEVRRQIVAADHLVLSKADLGDGLALCRAHLLLDQLGASSERVVLRPEAAAHEVAAVLRWAFRPTSRRVRPDSGPTHGGRQLVAVSIAEQGPLLLRPLQGLLSDLLPDLLRAKGLVRGEDGQVYILQVAAGHMELTPASADQAKAAPPGSVLVFIGESLDEEHLRLRLTACRAASR